MEELERVNRFCKDEAFIIEDGYGGASAEWHPTSGLMVKVGVLSYGDITYYISEGSDHEPMQVSQNLFTSILRVYGESIRYRRLY